jgi:hypothetical protein
MQCDRRHCYRMFTHMFNHVCVMVAAMHLEMTNNALCMVMCRDWLQCSGALKTVDTHEHGSQLGGFVCRIPRPTLQARSRLTACSSALL